MKKKLLAVLLAACMVAGCGTGSTTESVSSVSESADTESTEKETVSTEVQTSEEDGSIYIEKIEGFSDDFVKGVDISTVLVEEASGAVYKNENSEEEDLFKILSDAGVNYIRVRVWNNPYDEDGNGYGGGNCDYESAAEIGKRAAEYGMKLLVDFHYSDFWADPSKQFAPKAWEEMSLTEKETALYDYTVEALGYIISEGADVGMVQVGNEINNGMAGETDWNNIASLVVKGCEAVKSVNSDIKTVVHFTNVETPGPIYNNLKKLQALDAKVDVVGLSYYPYWHGDLTNLMSVINTVKTRFGYDAMCVENSYMFDTGDGDGNSNSVGSGDVCENYPASVQGQAAEVRDVCAAVSLAGGIGYFYWEPAWIPVDSSTWEQGSGWATSYASAYDPNDAGKYYGGCAWDNQAMFDYDGNALPSLNVFKYLSTGYGEPGSYTYREITFTPEEDDSEEAVMVEGDNLMPDYSFEQGNQAAWTLDGPFDFQKKSDDAYTGEYAIHYWDSGVVKGKFYRTVEGLENGTYAVGMLAQGGDSGTVETEKLYVTSGSNTYEKDFTVTTWANWREVQILNVEVTDGSLTLGVELSLGAGAWGTFDDFYIIKMN